MPSQASLVFRKVFLMPSEAGGLLVEWDELNREQWWQQSVTSAVMGTQGTLRAHAW